MISIDKLIVDDSVSPEAKVKILEDQIAQLKVKQALAESHKTLDVIKEVLEANAHPEKGTEVAMEDALQKIKNSRDSIEKIRQSLEKAFDATTKPYTHSATAEKFDASTDKEEKKRLLEEYGVYAHLAVLVCGARKYATEIDGYMCDHRTPHDDEIHEFYNKLREVCDEFDDKLTVW